MKNLNEKSNIITPKIFKKYSNIFKKCWSKETAFYTLSGKWNDNNKALGQCTPTSLIILDNFGGKLAYDKKNFHVWNILPDGTHQDFTRCQFNKKLNFCVYKYLTKKDVATNKVSIKNDTLNKYFLLKQNVNKLLETSDR